MRDKKTYYADYEPASEGEFPQIKLYSDVAGTQPFDGQIVVLEGGKDITFERVAAPKEQFTFHGLAIGSAGTNIPPVDWYVEAFAAHLRDLGNEGGSGVTTYLYTLSIRGADGKTVYLDPQLVNTGG